MPRVILVVDDVTSNRLILREMLQRDYEILEAVNGEDALDLLARRGESVSAVLLDIGMPGIDGFEVLRRIRKDKRHALMPVIMITVSEDNESRVRALSLGANDYVMKPYSSEIIKHCLQNNIALREASETVNILERDRLTGIWNRDAFFTRAAQLIEKAPAGTYLLACTDIEGFKVINDQYGSDMGDRILVSVANALMTFCCKFDGVCGRISADQFVCLLLFAQRKQHGATPESLEELVFADTGVRLTLSVGCYIIEDKSLGMNAMFDRASIAKSTVKGRYDSHVAVFDESMREKILREQGVVNEMNAALEGRQFEVWFQPQYNRATDAMIGAEALVRWRHPVNGLLAPDVFIPIFERNGFIYQLDRYVWEETCRYLRKWTDEGRAPLPVSVNISRYDVLRPDLIDTIVELVERYRLPRDMLRLEITETAFAQASHQIVNVVKTLIDLGFTVEIDDFGSGYSSLNTLKDVPAQIIKLDMRFLENSNDSERGGSIVESVVRMTKWLGASVIAEGVETVQQADYLRSIGCNYMQGYLFARPMPAAQYEAHCKGVGKEERLLVLETVENLDNNAFWDPASMDTLIFNSYVGAACIFEYSKERIEVVRSTERFAEMIGGESMRLEETLKLDWSAYLDEDNQKKLDEMIRRSKETNADVTDEIQFLGLPGCPEKTYIRSTIRVIETAGNRCLVYNIVENITARREAEQQAREAVLQMRMLMNDTPGGFCRMTIHGEESPALLYCNDGFARMLGMTQDDANAAYGADLFRCINKEDLVAASAEMTAAFASGGSFSARCRLRNKDGEDRWTMLSGRFVVSETGEPILNAYFSDIAAEITEQERQMQLLDNMPYGAALFEYDGQTLRAIHLNKKYWALVQLDPKVFNKLSVLEAIYPDDLMMLRFEIDTAIRQTRAANIDLRIRSGGADYRPFHVVANIEKRERGDYLIYAAYTPISEREMSIQDMFSVALSSIMADTPDIAAVKDAELRYVSCSRLVAELAGARDEKELVGKSVRDVFPAELAVLYEADDRRVLETGKALPHIPTSLPSDDGAPREAKISRYPLRDSLGKVIGVYCIGRDVTQEQMNYAQLKLVNDSVPGGIATYAVKNQEVRIVYCNDGYCRLFGSTRADFPELGEIDPIEWVHRDDRARVTSQINALVEHDTPIDCVYRVKAAGGGFKWISQKAAVSERRGNTLFFNSVLLDVTERQLITEQLRISEEENNLAVQHGGSIVCRYNVAEKCLTLFPNVALRSGMPERIDDVPYGPVRLGIISPETADAYVGFFEAILSGSPAGTLLYQQNYAGQWRWIEAKSSTIFSDEGAPVKAVISLLDVTEQLEKETIYKKWQHSLKERADESYTFLRCDLSRNAPCEIKAGALLKNDDAAAYATLNEQARAYAERCVYDDDMDAYIAFLNADVMIADYYRGKRSGTMDYRERKGDDAYRWIRLTVDLVESPNSVDVEAYLMYEDIDEAKKTELHTKELSQNDPLTGVLNRKTFITRMNRILQAAKPDEKHALLMLDLDGFKRVNDVFGHVAGDQALMDLADGMRAIMRRDDLVARLGGDEFVVFLNDVQDISAVLSKAKQIRLLARKSFSMEVTLSVSVGIAFFPRDGMDFDALYRKADSALYHVKGSGKDNQAVYSDVMEHEHMQPEEDTFEHGGVRMVDKKRRMLIVDDSSVDYALLQRIFRDEFIIEKAQDGSTALIRLRHYGSAISVMLLDLMMPGMDGFAVLEKMQESVEMRSIPVIMVSGNEDRETCLTAIKKGATDYITKPVDPELLRIRVRAAISKAENERLHAKNSLLEMQSVEQRRNEAFLESPGIAYIEYDWLTGEFVYCPSISNCLLGTFDNRKLWQILLSDMTADTMTVRTMQKLVHSVAESKGASEGMRILRLKTPKLETHCFRFHVRKRTNEYRLTNKIVITLTDLEYEAEHAH